MLNKYNAEGYKVDFNTFSNWTDIAYKSNCWLTMLTNNAEWKHFPGHICW
jgi:hypothetical protein